MNALEIFALIWFGIPLLLFIRYIAGRFFVVEYGYSMVVERLGRFNRVCGPGLHFLVPFIERPRPLTWRTSEVVMVKKYGRVTQSVHIYEDVVTMVDLRENIMDFPNQPVITRDNVRIDVHPCLFYRIIDAQRAVYETFDLDHAVEKLVQTTLRSIIGDMGLDDTLASRVEIEHALESRIKNICTDWGLEIISCELLEINPSDSVQDAMHEQLRAERERRAAIVTAEGFRQSTKTEAEGEANKVVNVAYGRQREAMTHAQAKADARVMLARAEAEAMRMIGRAMRQFGGNATQYVIGMKYVEALQKMASAASRRVVYFPFETDIVGGMADVTHAA